MVSNADDEGLLLEGEEVGEALEENDTDEVVKKKMNPCEICDKSFSNRAALNKHKSKNHPSVEEEDEDDADNSVVLDDPDDEDLLKENEDVIEIEEDIGENGSPNKSFDVVDVEELKKKRNSEEKRNLSDDEEDTPDETPEKKRIKTTPESQSKASNEDPIEYDLVISSSDYFTKNPKQITTKCNMGLHTKNIFTLTDPIMPNGWKMREHKKPDGSMEKHYLAPDGRVLKTRIAALEYLRIVKKYSKNEITAKGENKSKKNEDSVEVVKTVTPKSNPVSYSNDMLVRRKKHNKNKKDPNAPKRPMASYFLFTVEERPKVTKENPDWSVTQIAKELGQRWSQLEESIKKTFQDKAEEARKQYDIDIEEYRKTSSFSSFNDQKSVARSRRAPEQSVRRFGVGQECPKCGKKVTSVRTHMEDVHDPPGHFPCPGCKKVYKSKNCMSSHYSRNCKVRA